MKKQLISIFTTSPLHVGCGSAVGAIDAPVMRERHTRIPVIPGSSLKGVISSLWYDCDNYEKCGEKNYKRIDDKEAASLFGSESDNNAKGGTLIIGEARVVLFPVRSLRNGFAWVTCPLALTRLKQDSEKFKEITIPKLSGEDCYAAKELEVENGNIVIEEYLLKTTKDSKAFDSIFESVFKSLLPKEIEGLVSGRIVVVSDEMFTYFCENACQVTTRICIDKNTGVVKDGALFSVEEVPSETLFIAPIMDKKGDGIQKIQEKIGKENNFLQIGGDESTGLGLCKVEIK